jgi:hypothetical protein
MAPPCASPSPHIPLPAADALEDLALPSVERTVAQTVDVLGASHSVYVSHPAAAS